MITEIPVPVINKYHRQILKINFRYNEFVLQIKNNCHAD